MRISVYSIGLYCLTPFGFEFTTTALQLFNV